MQFSRSFSVIFANISLALFAFQNCAPNNYANNKTRETSTSSLSITDNKGHQLDTINNQTEPSQSLDNIEIACFPLESAPISEIYFGQTIQDGDGVTLLDELNNRIAKTWNRQTSNIPIQSALNVEVYIIDLNRREDFLTVNLVEGPNIKAVDFLCHHMR